MILYSDLKEIFARMYDLLKRDPALGAQALYGAANSVTGVIRDCDTRCEHAVECGVVAGTMVECCVRCGGTHMVYFVPIQHPADAPDAHTHWGWCPTTHEPVMMRRVVPLDEFLGRGSPSGVEET